MCRACGNQLNVLSVMLIMARVNMRGSSGSGNGVCLVHMIQFQICKLLFVLFES